jgi:hypothetical protein
MKTQITITVEHPSGTSASWVIADAVQPFLDDANGYKIDGWSFSISSTTEDDSK